MRAVDDEVVEGRTSAGRRVSEHSPNKILSVLECGVFDRHLVRG